MAKRLPDTPELVRKRKQKLESYHRNREVMIARTKEWRDYNKLAVVNVLIDGEGTCRWCGQGDIDVLTVDHVHDNGAEHRKTVKGSIGIYFWLIKNGYPEGYQILCWNCNIKKLVLKRRGTSGVPITRHAA